ncbi:phosphotransferase family protein [Paenibacillus gorillae]|uniref:phosphotransferase family protein n=1 Tax=Paenibacillus gorillae TaxID=1243662 RepID=UPI0004AF4A91|nr:aminoglycoside phosphotransferase family protein [Paenibacillus gorillae]
MSSHLLSEQALRWVIDAVHPDATVLAVKRLYGGVSSPVHSLTLSIDGQQRDYVLRQIDNKEWLQEQPDLTFREAESLRRASGISGVAIPEVIALDETGSSCGMPALLMTKLDGEVVLEPANLKHWVDGLAETLAKLHSGSSSDSTGFPWTFAAYSDASKLDTSLWSKHPEEWQEAARIVLGPPPVTDMQFIHRDYHPANVLWHEGKVSGVVDWVNGCLGPAGIDVGHCRANLVQLYDVQTADDFLTAYQAYRGDSFTYHPYWDLVTVADFSDGETPEVYEGWTALGMKGLTPQLMAERLDSYVISLMNRVRG